MGSAIEITDTLKISRERGFPENLRLEDHVNNPDLSRRFLGKSFDFWNKDERLYHRPPTRVWLVEEMPDGKWLYWGHAIIESQTVGFGKTSGRYCILMLYHPVYQQRITIEESPKGKSYFADEPTSLRIT